MVQPSQSISSHSIADGTPAIIAHQVEKWYSNEALLNGGMIPQHVAWSFRAYS